MNCLIYFYILLVHTQRLAAEGPDTEGSRILQLTDHCSLLQSGKGVLHEHRAITQSRIAMHPSTPGQADRRSYLPTELNPAAAIVVVVASFALCTVIGNWGGQGLEGYYGNPQAADHCEDAQATSPDKTDWFLLIMLMLCIGGSETTTQNVATLLPNFTEAHHKTLSSFLVGVLLGSYQIGYLCAAFAAGNFMSQSGRKHAIVTGLLVMSFSSVLFAAGSFFPDSTAFFAVSLLGRVAAGAADAICSVAIYSVASIEFPERTEVVMGYLTACVALGLLSGPVMGSAMYGALGYAGTFCVFGGFVFLLALAAHWFIPCRVNRTAEADVCGGEATWAMFIRSTRAMTMFLLFCLSNVFFWFVDPILALQLIKHGMSVESSGLGFATMAFAMLVSAPLAMNLCEGRGRWALILLSAWLTTCAIFLLGPSAALDLPDETHFIFCGMFLIGAGLGVQESVFVPELVESVKQDQSDGKARSKTRLSKTSKSLSNSINDKAATLLCIGFAVGSTVAPPVGGMLKDTFGFRSACDVMAFSSLCVSLLYTLFLVRRGQ